MQTASSRSASNGANVSYGSLGRRGAGESDQSTIKLKGSDGPSKEFHSQNRATLENEADSSGRPLDNFYMAAIP